MIAFPSVLVPRRPIRYNTDLDWWGPDGPASVSETVHAGLPCLELETVAPVQCQMACYNDAWDRHNRLFRFRFLAYVPASSYTFISIEPAIGYDSTYAGSTGFPSELWHPMDFKIKTVSGGYLRIILGSYSWPSAVGHKCYISNPILELIN